MALNKQFGIIVELLYFLGIGKVNKLERDISIHDDPANDVTDLVPIIKTI